MRLRQRSAQVDNRASTGVLQTWRRTAVPSALIGFVDFDLSDALGTTVVAQEPDEMGRQAALLARQDDLDLTWLTLLASFGLRACDLRVCC